MPVVRTVEAFRVKGPLVPVQDGITAVPEAADTTASCAAASTADEPVKASSAEFSDAAYTALPNPAAPPKESTENNTTAARCKDIKFPFIWLVKTRTVVRSHGSGSPVRPRLIKNQAVFLNLKNIDI
jgi:hypothetical protein